MSIVARFFANGEFSQGVDTTKRRRDKQRRHKDCRDKNWRQRRDEYLQWREQAAKAGLISYKLPFGAFMRSRSGYVYWVEAESHSETNLCWEDSSGCLHTTRLLQSVSCVAATWGLVPLVHQLPEFSEKPKTSRKKLQCMTKNMARNIRNGVYLLEKQPGGKDCLSFLTLTLPDLTKEELNACCQKWDYMVSRFVDWLSVSLKKKNIQPMYVYCTEIQSKRLQNRGEYAPHLHMVFRGRNGRKAPWAFTPKQIRKAWKRCIASVVHRQFASDALENLQRIKYSAARYLAKYLSKSSKILPNESGVFTESPLRTHWGGMARCISRLIRQSTQKFTGTSGNGFFLPAFLRSLPYLQEHGHIKYYKRGYIDITPLSPADNKPMLHVSCGCLSVPTFEGGVALVINCLLNAGLLE